MNQNTDFEQASIFDLGIDDKSDKKLNVVEAEFKNVHAMNWDNLFKGYDELYAITYSSGIDFISRVLPDFRYAEIIFGCEKIIDDNVAMIMSVQFSQLKFISQHKSAKKLAARIEDETLPKQSQMNYLKKSQSLQAYMMQSK